MLTTSVVGATAGDLAKPSAMATEGRYNPVHFYLDSQETGFQNELGFYFVDGPDGRITLRDGGDPEGAPLLDAKGQPQFVRPGDPGYAAAALASANSQVVFARGEIANPGTGDTFQEFAVDAFVGFYLIQDATTDDWRAGGANAPQVWFSFANANADRVDHFVRTNSRDTGYRSNTLQYKVEDSSRKVTNANGQAGDSDFNDWVFTVNLLPIASSDDYSVFNAGANFQGAPVGFKADSPTDVKNRGQGLLGNDIDFRPNTPVVVNGVRLDDDSLPWIPVAGKGGTLLSDASLHGSVTIYANGGIDYVPDPNDAYWHPQAGDPEPDAIYFQYQVTDGLDTNWNYVSISHGIYQRGAAPDSRHQGQKMYLLDGGSEWDSLADAKQRFFTTGSAGGDIVLFGQGLEQKDRVDSAFDDFAQGTARSVTGLNITLREQCNDPRLSRIVDGADVLWLGGGAQSFYTSRWAGTLMVSSLVRAASSPVAIGGTSAGLAVLGQFAYVDLPWDSIRSSFATQRPFDSRVNVLPQGAPGLPFASLSTGAIAPLSGYIFDTHFSARDRMGRLITFAARSRMIGIGVDEETALLVEPAGRNDWRWSVYGDGSVYLVGQMPSGKGLRSLNNWTIQDSRLSTNDLSVIRLDASRTVSGLLRSQVFALAADYRIKVIAGTVFSFNNNGSLYG